MPENQERLTIRAKYIKSPGKGLQGFPELEIWLSM